MLPLGILSLLQIWFLPGFALLCWQPYRLRLPQAFVLVLLASLTVNFAVVWGLVLLGLYDRWAIIFVVCIEALAISAALIRKPKDFADLGETGSETIATPCLGNLVFSGAIAVALVIFAYFFLREVGEIHHRCDAITSWNRWATAWADGHFPKHTWGYPQLLPMMWSITHVMIGSKTIQVFAHLVNLIFPLAGLLVAFDAYLQRPKPSTGMAVLTLATVLLAVDPVRDWAFSGYADIPVAIFCLISVLLLFSIDDAPSEFQIPLALTGALAAGLAAATKQAGLLMVFAYPVLLAATTKLPRATKLRLAIISIGLGAFLAAPSYAAWQYRLSAGQDKVLIETVVTAKHLHGDRDVIERLAHAMSILYDKLGLALITVLIAAYIFALRDTRWRWVLCLFVLPYTIIWAVGFSYSLRNLLPIIPLSAALCGLAAAPVWDRFQTLYDRQVSSPWPPPWPKVTNPRRWVALAMFCLVAMATLLPIGDADLHARQTDQLWKIGDEALNRAVSDLIESEPEKPLILTNYAILKRLPLAPSITYKRANFRDWQSLSKLISANPSAVVLIWAEVPPEVNEGFDRFIIEGRYGVVFENDDARLLTPRKGAP